MPRFAAILKNLISNPVPNKNQSKHRAALAPANPSLAQNHTAPARLARPGPVSGAPCGLFFLLPPCFRETVSRDDAEIGVLESL
jgi:hypothetical protein